MSIMDKIFRKRLERIREELNKYIESRSPITEGENSIPESATKDEKDGGVLDKFLDHMKLNDEGADDDCDEQDSKRESLKRSSACRPSPLYSAPTGTARIPDFQLKMPVRIDLDRVLAEKKESFSELLLRMIDEKGLKDSEVYKSANIDRRLFSKIRGDNGYIPSKKTAISFCLALQLDVAESKQLLATAGYTLSASSRFDLIILYLIENCEYNIHFANIVLDDYGEGTLSR